MKLLLLFAFVNGVFSYFNHPNFEPDVNYLRNCKQQTVLNGQGDFTTFIPLGELTKNKPRKGSKERLNTIICYRGDPDFRLAVTRLKKPVENGDKFIGVGLSIWDSSEGSYASDIYYENFNSGHCTGIHTPPFLSGNYVNCISLELEDYYSGGYGRVSVSSLGKFPVTINCYGVTGGLISGLNYLTLTTYDKQSKGGIFYYNCDRFPIRSGVYGKKPGIVVNANQEQRASI